MKYVIRNCDTGLWVSLPGSKHSYTNKLQNARKYPSREAAQGDACGNEIAQSLDEAAGAE